jgi:hypothetical protein
MSWHRVCPNKKAKTQEEDNAMKWIEVIMLQSAAKNPETLEQEVEKLTQNVINGSSLKEIKLYRHALLDNDLSVHLQWESEKAEPQGSALGLCLSHVLKDFGLVSHAVWIEDYG